MKKSINLGGKEYEYTINFKLSYDFSKYRNRIAKGYDFTNTDKSVVEEIVKVQEEMQKLEEANKEVNEYEFLQKLSPKAIDFLENNKKPSTELFTEEEIIDIISRLTGLKNEEEILKILDEEINMSSFDILIDKIISAITAVFTNAKDNSQQEETSKAELVKVAKK